MQTPSTDKNVQPDTKLSIIGRKTFLIFWLLWRQVPAANKCFDPNKCQYMSDCCCLHVLINILVFISSVVVVIVSRIKPNTKASEAPTTYITHQVVMFITLGTNHNTIWGGSLSRFMFQYQSERNCDSEIVQYWHWRLYSQIEARIRCETLRQYNQLIFPLLISVAECKKRLKLTFRLILLQLFSS